MGSINALDIGVAVIVLISALMAYARGFVRSFLYLVAWGGAIFATIYGYPHAKPYAHSLIKNDLAADITAGVVIFIVTLIVLSLVSQTLGKMVQDSVLNMLDRSLGFLFGIFRGVVVVCLLYLGVQWAMPPDRQPLWLRSARSIPLIQAGVTLMKSLVPGEAITAGKGAAQNAGNEAQNLFESETKKTFNRILTPEPKGTAAEPRSGYSDQERREIDRLIDNSQ